MSNTTQKKKGGAVWSTIRPFLIGGTSGCMATCCIQPIDMVKVRIQLMGEGTGVGVARNPVAVAANIIKTDGFFSLYNGLSAALVRQLTYGMTRLGIFRTLTNRFTPEGGTAADISSLTRLGCSLTAGGVGALIGTPADAALVRMQADATLPKEQQRHYKNAGDALIRMAREEGLSGFFSGASPTVFRGLLINVGMFMTFDPIKKTLGPFLGGEKSQTNRFVSGAISGASAATLCLPADFIKTRLQKQKPNADGVLPYKGVFDCARKVAASEGVLALYNGYPTFLIRITPHIMLTWVFMDNLNELLKKQGL